MEPTGLPMDSSVPSPAAESSLYYNTPPSEALDFMQFPGMNFDFTGMGSSAPTDLAVAYPTPQTAPVHPDDIMDFQMLENFQLPPRHILVQLFGLFFENLGHMFPCFHKKSFMVKVECGDMETDAPLLLYAICSVTARYHPDDSVKECGKYWYEQARFSYELTRRRPDPGLRTLQVALLLVFHASTIGDFSSSWLFLGKAWRQVVVLGMNRMDVSHAYMLERSERETAVEREEYRRALWLLFIMDRAHAWPTGWPNTIPEIQFMVNIPVSDTQFQNMEAGMETSVHEHTPFTRDLESLVSSSPTAKEPLNIFHYITVAHVLLGRVSELVHSLHNLPDTVEYANDCTKLDDLLVKFRLSLPRQASSVLEASPADRGHVVWLQVTLNVVAIMLHYRYSQNDQVSGANPKFALAVLAAGNIAQIIKDASRISTDLLLSVHIASALYVAACVLVMQWRLTGDRSLREDIDLFRLVFERMDEVFTFLGMKFKVALEHDLKKSKEDLISLQERGLRGLLGDCQKWTHVKQEVQRRGIDIDVT
ncbi:hypothetical protein BDW02DRAFT_566819 [Decorospora gaudefroyi]|uniref:Xylanolytic transcriptional activator regulatory domain-containing protein n=1 Tax=Decorospora gaudefroyi TaxID=184978 RepID=A0A6A5KLR8_9PLEO|nr:hypothetical protein BDW02DRAFT_566819 [Decorospora gaudefroyi]